LLCVGLVTRSFSTDECCGFLQKTLKVNHMNTLKKTQPPQNDLPKPMLLGMVWGMALGALAGSLAGITTGDLAVWLSAGIGGGMAGGIGIGGFVHHKYRKR
jgi:hypothetical protein